MSPMSPSPVPGHLDASTEPVQGQYGISSSQQNTVAVQEPRQVTSSPSPPWAPAHQLTRKGLQEKLPVPAPCPANTSRLDLQTGQEVAWG